MSDLLQGITIRPIVPGDEEKVNEFFSVMGPESTAFFNRGRGNQKGVLDFCQRQDTDRRIYWMAELDGKMAGLVFLCDVHTTIPWLGIAVREELKGRHLGKTLIRYAQDYALANGKGGIQLITSLANIRGQCLYEGMGFRRMGIHGASGEWYYLFRFGEDR